MKTKKRLLSILLSLALVLGLMPGMSLTAMAGSPASVPYTFSEGDGNNVFYVLTDGDNKISKISIIEALISIEGDPFWGLIQVCNNNDMKQSIYNDMSKGIHKYTWTSNNSTNSNSPGTYAQIILTPKENTGEVGKLLAYRVTFSDSTETISGGDWTYPEYIVPTDLTATVGQTLNDVTFPTVTNGTWSWADSTTSVGEVGSKTFKATFTPTDNNQKTVSDIEVPVTVTAHVHNFTYTASGATITATCGNTTGCSLSNSGYKTTMTLSATDTTFTGSAYSEASLSYTDAWTASGLTVPTIEYVGRGSTSYTKSTTAPTNAGTYTASITMDTDKIATVDFTISPMALTIESATATDSEYDKDSTAVTISAVTFKDSSQQAEALTLGEDKDYTVIGAMTDANAGNGKTVNVTVTLKNANYSLTTNTTTTTVNISKTAAQTIADVTDSLLYTATSVSESVADKMPDDAGTLNYTAGTAAKTGSVTVSDFAVNATSGAVTATLSGGAAGDTVTLPVTISSTNYADSSVNVKITLTAKGTQTITAENVTATYGDTDKSVSASVTEPATGGGAISYAVKDGSADYIEVNATTGTLTIKKVPTDGKAYVVVTAAETQTYAQATKEVTVTINKANAVPATVTANNRTYDGTEKPLVTVTGETIGGTMKIAVTTVDQEPDAEAYTFDTTSIPTATNAGTYYVWYKVIGDANHTDATAASVTVTIEKASITPAVALTGWTYGATANTPSVSGNIGNGTVTYEYKVKDSADSTYASDVPTTAGEYTVKIGREASRERE